MRGISVVLALSGLLVPFFALGESKIDLDSIRSATGLSYSGAVELEIHRICTGSSSALSALGGGKTLLGVTAFKGQIFRNTVDIQKGPALMDPIDVSELEMTEDSTDSDFRFTNFRFHLPMSDVISGLNELDGFFHEKGDLETKESIQFFGLRVVVRKDLVPIVVSRVAFNGKGADENQSSNLLALNQDDEFFRMMELWPHTAVLVHSSRKMVTVNESNIISDFVHKSYQLNPECKQQPFIIYTLRKILK